MTWFILIILLVVLVKCIANKIAALSLLMYMKDYYSLPDESEIKKYTSRAAKKLFHIPTKRKK